MLMSTLVWVIMAVGELLLVGTLPALAANALVRRILALAALGATINTAAGCTRGAFAARTAAATTTTATSAATTATRLAIAFSTVPVGTAICTLCFLTFSTCGEWRARVNAISDVIRGAIGVSRAIHVAATVRIRWATCVTGPIALTVVATAVTLAVRVVPIPITAIVAIAPALATIPLRVVLATTTRRPIAATWPAIAVTMPATTAAALCALATIAAFTTISTLAAIPITTAISTVTTRSAVGVAMTATRMLTASVTPAFAATA
jgi:hypothetical protein